MTPTAYSDLKSDFNITVYPTRTYRLNTDDNRVTGYVSGLSAMEQVIYKILCTDRYKHIIYSRNYGFKVDGLIGKPIAYVQSVVKQRITEALMQDDRITNVYNFAFTQNRADNSLLVTFNVDTTEGAVISGTEVNLSV